MRSVRPGRRLLALSLFLAFQSGVSCTGSGPEPNPNPGGATSGPCRGRRPGGRPRDSVVVAPGIAVKDRNGVPVAGATVSFAVTRGGGTIEVSSAQTDAAGQATCGKWTLGPAAGINNLTATVAGIDPITFTATAIPGRGVPSRIAVWRGYDQVAAPGTAVEVAPEVYVQDGTDILMEGVAVTFTVTSGGGSVRETTVLTDAGGHANCGAWTMGPLPGIGTLSASIPGVAPVTFTAKAVRSSPTLSMGRPCPMGGLVGDSVPVRVGVYSQYQVASVTASAAGRSTSLSYGSSGWAGTLSLAGVPRGPLVLVFTVTDATGQSVDAVVPVTLDRPPVLTVTSPTPGTVAHPTIEIVATCVDDDPAGCEWIKASVWPHSGELASAKDSLSVTVDLSSRMVTSNNLSVVARDFSGQFASVSMEIFVEPSPHMIVKAEVPGVQALDASGTRVLFLGDQETTPALKVLDGATGAIDVLDSGPNFAKKFEPYGFLMPAGAIYAYPGPRYSAPNSLFEARGGRVEKLATGFNSLVVAGTWAGFEAEPGYWRRDLLGGVSEAASAADCGGDVASNGDVVYASTGGSGGGCNVFRWRGGAVEALTHDDPAVLDNRGPLTDGAVTVYRKNVRGAPYGTGSLTMHDGSREVAVGGPGAGLAGLGAAYAVAGGYVAYVEADGFGTGQVWRLGPGGVEQLTVFSTPSVIDGIAPDGTVLLTNRERRYRAAPGSPLQDIGWFNGRVIVRDGKPLILLGRDVFELGP